MSKLGLSNMILFQWFGFRLAKKVGARTTWHMLRWVWPLTGWWGRYYWIYRVWPSAEAELVDGIALEVAKGIDQEIVKELFAPVIKPLGEWPGKWPPPPPLPPPKVEDDPGQS